jgi:hypothetical protein
VDTLATRLAAAVELAGDMAAATVVVVGMEEEEAVIHRSLITRNPGGISIS